MSGIYIGQWWKGKAIDERKPGETGGGVSPVIDN